MSSFASRTAPDPVLLIFDLDGTLVDTGSQITRAWGQILSFLGRQALSQDSVETMVGDGAAKLVERGLAATGGVPPSPSFDALVTQYVDALAAEPLSESDLYPGVMATLARFRDTGHMMAVCTNKPIEAAETALRMTKIRPFFDLVVGGGSAAALKPDPAPVRTILDRLGVAPGQAVMIGDHANDVRAGRGAGVRTLMVTYGYPNASHADLGAPLIDRFDALPDALQERESS